MEEIVIKKAAENAIDGKKWHDAVAILEQMRPGSYLHKYWDSGESIGSDEAFNANRLKVGANNGIVVLTWQVIDWKGKPRECYATWG